MNEAYAGADPRVVQAADLGLGCGTPIDLAGIEPGMTVLDLGSGAGIDVFLAAQRVGPTGRAIGLDMTDAMLVRARANRQKLGILNTEFRKGDIEAMPVQDETIDRIVSNCVINLVPDKKRAFSEMYRVLKPGGAFVISDIVYTGTMPDDLRNNPGLVAACVSGASSREEYLDFIRGAGFRTVEVLKEHQHPLPEQLSFMLYSVTIKGEK
jgi:ubiquinone/menaquinone biosynthesis C-methylase UbiE